MSLIDIILRAKPLLYQSENINALWIEGSYATGKFDETSDIDIWIDVPDAAQQEAAADVKNAISRVTTLKAATDIQYYSEDPKLAKLKFYIEGMSDDNRIELDIQEASRDFTFSRQDHDMDSF